MLARTLLVVRLVVVPVLSAAVGLTRVRVRWIPALALAARTNLFIGVILIPLVLEVGLGSAWVRHRKASSRT